MNRVKTSLSLEFVLGLAVVALTCAPSSFAASSIDLKKSAEGQVRTLLEPILEKYCHDKCKLIQIRPILEASKQEESNPGFEDPIPASHNVPVVTSVNAKILLDDQIGPVSRSKLIELMQQFLETLEYPVHLETQLAHFPMPQGSEAKIAELREQVSKKFLGAAQELLTQFCPQHCMLADYDLQTEVVNGEEVQFNNVGEYLHDGDTAVRIKRISATLLLDHELTPDEQKNIAEMLRLKTNHFKHVEITPKVIQFPRPPLAEEGQVEVSANGTIIRRARGGRTIASEQKNHLESQSKVTAENRTSDSKSSESSSNSSSSENITSQNQLNSKETNVRKENYHRIERIERVENSDAVQVELRKFKIYGLIASCFISSLLILLIGLLFFRKDSTQRTQIIDRILGRSPSEGHFGSAAASTAGASTTDSASSGSNGAHPVQTAIQKYEIDRLKDELISIYAQNPKVAKHVFGRLLTEEGIETVAQCMSIFGDSIVLDMLKDPSLQTDLMELLEYYAKTPIELDSTETLEILKALHHRTVAGKLVVLGSRSSNLFDFLSEMDATQVMELIKSESMIVKSIVLTQCDVQKRAAIFSFIDPEERMKLLGELSRIDYLPRDFIFNVANALKRKRKENPKLNTEPLPGSEVLVSLLEKTGRSVQRSILKELEANNPESARTVKNKLISIDTLRYLREGQLLEVVLNLKHEELIQFLKGAPEDICKAIFSKSPKDLVLELEDELAQIPVVSREMYQAVERKILNRIKVMANDGQINLVETNERMLSDTSTDSQTIAEKNLRKTATW